MGRQPSRSWLDTAFILHDAALPQSSLTVGKGERGPAYNPTLHHPLLIPTTGAAGPNWSFDDFTWALAQATDGSIAILTFHGVPDIEHPWVHIEPAQFEEYMAYLYENDYKVIALRDLADYVNPHAL